MPGDFLVFEEVQTDLRSQIVPDYQAIVLKKLGVDHVATENPKRGVSDCFDSG